jgi:hypothetical protein
MVLFLFLRRWFIRIFLAIAAITTVSYLGDSAVFLLRGSPTSTVAVSQFMSIPLKGQKIEYDYLGRAQMPCSESLYPHGGQQPCWYLRRDPNVWENI